MKEQKHLTLTANEDEKLRFEITFLKERVKNLEAIVYELLRNRINKELPDGWLESTYNTGFSPSVSMIEGRGAQIADALDRFPAAKFDSSKWPEKKPLK